MISNIFKVLLVIFPVATLLWFAADRQGFTRQIENINQLQGADGLLVINPRDGSPSYGECFSDFLKATFVDYADKRWNLSFSQRGRELDGIIRSIENYWLWGIIGSCFAAMLIFIFLAKSYK